MDSRAKLAGHAIHPMLIVFPLGLLATAFVFDLIHVAKGSAMMAIASYWMIAAGIIGGLVSAVFGLVDWLAIPNGTRAKLVGAWHGGGNVVVVAIFAVSWFLRRGHAAMPGVTPIVLAGIGVVLSCVTGWLGGELVERMGVGVDRGAHLDAPSSLSGRMAASTAVPEVPEERLRRAG